MKTLTLNFKKWRCGRDGGKNVAHGEGWTRLLNIQGYMCCLGQFSTQLNPKVTRDNILECSSPCSLSNPIPILSKTHFGDIENTSLSNKSIEINDDDNTSIDQKIKSLKTLFRTKGYKINITNLPKQLAKKLKLKKIKVSNH